MRKHLLLAIALLCAVVQGAWAQTTNVSNETELRGAIEDNANITLTQNIDISEAITVGNGQTVTIDLGGFTLNRGCTSRGSQVIGVYSGGTLYLSNGTVTGGWGGDGGAMFNEGTMHLDNVTISGNTADDRGGGLSNNGTLTMTDCTVSNNTSRDNVDPAGGGGIFNYNGKTATLTNCTIEKNTTEKFGGGGICNYGTMYLNICTLTENTATTKGGGIWNGNRESYTGTLYINGCTITDNSAGGYGDGIYIDNSTINMQGLCKVTGNTDSNIYLYGSGTVITVTGAFTDGSNIGVGFSDYGRKFTSGYSTYNDGTDPGDFFTSDNGYYAIGKKDGEAYPGIPYVERSWEGGNTDGHVVSTNKVCTDYSQYNGETDLSNGWYVITGNNTYNDRLACHNDVKFILLDGYTAEFTKGIHIDDPKYLTIYGQTNDTGKLKCSGSGDAANAAIGGNKGQMSGNLIIHGGTIEASSSENNAAAIGGGDGSSSGMQSVTIYGGTVTATGMSSGAGIGGGQENNTVPSVTIYGGTINATGGNYAAGIGGSEESTAGTVKIYGGKVTATGGKDGAGIGGGENGDCGKVYIYGGEVTASSNDYGAGIGGGENGDNGTVYIYGGTVKATGGKNGSGIGGGKDGGGGTVYIYDGDVTATGGQEGGGIAGDDLTIKIYGGKIHAMGRVGSEGRDSGPGVGVMNGSGKLYFTMDGGELTAEIYYPDKQSSAGAGIGGRYYEKVELHVTINGGTITANGGKYAAGIGAGAGSNSGNGSGNVNSGSEITINGGTVNATGGKGAAGIGAGCYGNQKGIITINGGIVNAKGGDSGTGSKKTTASNQAGAGIGGGGEYTTISTGGNAGTIRIYGGTVTATPGTKRSDNPAQAIGHGEGDNNEGTLTLGDNLCVTNDNGSTTYGSGDRVSKCRDYATRVVKVCEHSEKICTSNGDSGHTINCSYCSKTGSESHNFDTDGHTCKSCDYVMTDLKTIKIYEANSAGTGYNSTPTTYSVQYNTTFTLPECTSVPNNMWFAGWKETTTEPASIQAESSEFSSLKAAGTEITVTDDVTYYARYHTSVWPGGGSGTAGDPYLISKEEHWNEFVNAVSNKNFDFSGRYLQLTADIDVSQMVGTSSNRFRGTFDGDGHTLTVNYDTSEQYTAPFRFVGSANISNLHVSGNIRTSAKFASGLIGGSNGSNANVTNCRVSVTIESSVNGDGTHGGFVANITSGTVNIKGCIFDGEITGSSTTNCGGFVGWISGTAANLTDCLFMPTSLGLSSGCYTFVRRAERSSISNCFYTSALGTAQGTQAYTVQSGDIGLTLDYGSGNNYGSITAYTFDQGNNSTLGGLLYQSQLYTGGTTKVTFTPEADFSFTALEASNGETLTANSDGTYTLTMNNDNVSVTATHNDYVVTLYDNQTNSATIEENSGRKANVTISGRTLYKDGSWNTLCLPFDVTANQIALTDHPLYGATIMEMDTENSSFNTTTNKVSVAFKAATKIKAGKSYIVKWTTTGTVVDPTFLGSTIDDDSPKTVESTDGKVSFTGNYDPLTGSEADGLLFDSKNTNKGAFHAALGVDLEGYTVKGWFTDAEKNTSATSIPFDSDNGAVTVTLYTTFKKLLSNQDITITIATQTWTGNAIEPAVTVMDGSTDISDECEFAYSDNTDVGTATVTVTAKSDSENYAGSTTASFTIANYQATLYVTADNTDELTNIKDNHHGKADVTLSGITLKRTKNAVQTICLPFDLDSFTDTPLDGFTVQTPTSGEVMPENATTYVVKCSETTYIVAHQPYILKWTQSAESDIENPKFEDVTIESVTPVEVKLGDNVVSLCGTYAPKPITASGSDYYVTTEGNVSNAEATVNAMEVYIHNNSSYTQIVIGGDTPVTPTVWTGSGTESDPYLITSIADLDALSNYVRDGKTFSGKHFKMTANINYSEKEVTDGPNFMPIGNTYYRFSGTFDGDGHSISGISIETGYEDQGVFGFVDNNGTVKNLTLTNSTIKAAGEVGGIAGRSRGTIENCHVTSSVTITVSDYGTSGFGGIVGTSYGTISGCTSAARVGATDEYYIGGIAGYLSGSSAKMKNCLYIGNSVVGSGYVGALCGSKGSNASLTRNFYKLWDGCPGAVNGGDTDGAKPGYTVESGTEGLTLDYGDATTSYNNNGIKAYSFDQGNDQTAGGLLYQSMLYTGGTTKVTFTPKASNGQQPTLSASNGETIANNGNGTWTLTMNNADVTVTATAYSNYDVMLYDDSHNPTNTTTLQEYNGLTADVTISGRTLYKDGNWNTLCLPFNVTSEQINAQDGDNNYTSPLHGATIMELDVEGKYDADGNLADNGTYQTSFASDGTLNLYFKAAESIEAGKPYIVKWETTGDPIVKPTFSSVTIESSDTKLVTSADGNVSFVGNYDPVYTDEDGDATKLYLGAGNKLYYPSGIRAINAFRAYFQLNNGITAGEPKSGQQQVRAFYLNFGDDEETTGITTTNYTNFTNSDNAWYDMQGRKVARSASPLGSSKNGQWSMVNGQLKKGLYIYNGKKVVIK